MPLPIRALTDRKQYAVPVQFEKLVAGVEAFVETRPVVDALRECIISKLPLEVVDMIEEFVVAPERERLLVHWTKLKRCWEGKCVLEDDHPISADEVGCECFKCAPEECKDRDHPLNLTADGHVCPLSICYLTGGRLGPPCLFTKILARICKQNVLEFEEGFLHGTINHRKPLLEKHLDIDIWSTQTYSGVNKEAVLSWLVLPGNIWRTREWERSRARLDQENGFGIPVHVGATPSSAYERRFRKAMKKLGLKPFVHCAQKHTKALSVAQSEEEVSEGEVEVSENEEEVSESEEELAEGEEKTDGRDRLVPDEAGPWPKLILLTQGWP